MRVFQNSEIFHLVSDLRVVSVFLLREGYLRYAENRAMASSMQEYLKRYTSDADTTAKSKTKKKLFSLMM